MSIIFTQSNYEKMTEHCASGLPNEACGLLGGICDEAGKHVRNVYLLTNMDASPEHFTMDPSEQFAALKDMQKAGIDLIGNFHSHPDTPSRASEEDKRLAFDQTQSYVIISFIDRDAPVIKSFRITDGISTEEPILVQE
ncbi:MAG: M67 family metallopeptidase [Clostridiales Family XIII bacterium]|jgi:proteasome lid subunit RPN8/RPN11|nr:M67 family metallopeptidase [Clostridiales Family XIII bacterium]